MPAMRSTTTTYRRPQRAQPGFLRSILSIAWESAAVRLLAFCLALGAIPFYFLSLAIASLGG